MLATAGGLVFRGSNDRLFAFDATDGRELWSSLAVVTALWVVVYFVTADPFAGNHSVGQSARLVWRSVNHAIVGPHPR